MLLLGNGPLITWNPQKPFFADGCIAIEDNIIADFGPTADLRAKYPHAEYYDARGRVIMPGLINAHTHIYSSFARGLSLPQAEPSRTFMDILKNQWWRMDKVLNEEDNRYSAYATGLESIRLGVTTLFDHHASQRHVRGSLGAIADSLGDLGMRACLCYEVSDRDGKDIAREGIAENIAMIDRAARDESDMLKGMLGLHASFTLSPQTLAACTEAMGERDAGYHVHVAESIDDQYDALAQYGKRVVERLYDAGILGPKTLAVHNVHINAAEMALLSDTGTMAVHNPESNMGNAVGCTPVLQMLSRGIPLGLGTDAYTQDMLESLKVAKILQSHELSDPSVGFSQAVSMLFETNAAICGRFFKRPLGIVAEGAYADMIVMDYKPHTPLNADTIAGHVVFGMTGRGVDCTLINGVFVMKDRMMQRVDEEMLLEKSRVQSADFWRRVTA